MQGEKKRYLQIPTSSQVTDPYKDLIHPAVKGTQSILNSVHGPNGRSVKRLVITSSLASIYNPHDDINHVYNEEEWNVHSPKVVEEKGKEAPPLDAYYASKAV